MPKEKIKKIKKTVTQEVRKLRLEVLQKMSDLVTAGLGLVAALAWNEAIKAMFNTYFPQPGGNLLALTVYALFITILVVVLTIYLGRTVNLAKKSIDDNDEKRSK
ncbi:MAG: DUF5654 family protein [Candidatus Buchananbacteria bacterium]